MLKIVTNDGIAYPNMDNIVAVGINKDDTTVRFTEPDGYREDFRLATREEKARLIRTLDKYVIEPAFHE